MDEAEQIIAMTTSSRQACSVCGDPMDPPHTASCLFCSGTFHLTWDTRVEVKDCGRFDLDDQSLALYFTCGSCAASRGMGAQAT